MNKKLWAILVVVLVVTLTLPGCTRSASKAPISTSTSSDELPFPLPVTDDAMKNILASGTQTAQAAGNAPQPVATQPPAGEATLPPLVLPTPDVPAATPTTAPTFVSVPSPTPGQPSTYTLHDGEWPFCIARRYNIDAADLMEANDLSVDSQPGAGATLTLPTGAGKWSAGPRALVAHPAYYTVEPGDTIYSIACAYGDADPNAIIAANNLKSPYTLTSGQIIQVP